MAECKHELQMLMGTADGIVCRGCGRLFKSFDEIHPSAEAVPASEKPKRRRKKEDAENVAEHGN